MNPESELIVTTITKQGCRQKNFQGVGAMEKRPKNNKKDRKIAVLSLYLLYLYHV